MNVRRNLGTHKCIAPSRSLTKYCTAEMRLPSTIYYAVWVPISLFWYGWAVEKKAHWYEFGLRPSKRPQCIWHRWWLTRWFNVRAVTIVGMVPFGFGMVGIFLPCQTYLVDAFPGYSASAVAASRTSLSIVGAFLPLAGPPLYQSLGYGLGNSVLGLIALVMTPIPALLYK